MSAKTLIEWTDATWNPVTGCSKVSSGCKNCYALREWARLSAPRPQPNVYTGRAFTDVAEHMDRLEQPLRWTKPRRVFVNSMSDLFHEDVSPPFIADVFGVMAAAPQHTFQVLTKRASRMRQLLNSLRFFEQVKECAALYTHTEPTWPLPNVWVGVSTEDQATADARIPELLATPAAVRFISAEPMLGAIDLRELVTRSDRLLTEAVDALRGELSCVTDHGSGRIDPCARLDWVIVGGESGPKARPMHPDWARSLRDQCAHAGVPFHFKQWGEWIDHEQAHVPNTLATAAAALNHRPDGYDVRIGKKAAGRLLDGRTHDEAPA